MGSAPLGAAHPDFRIPIPLNYPDYVYWQEIITRRVTLALLVIYCIIVLLGIVGNGLVIYILGFHMKKTVNTIWFFNLTVANFIFTCSLPLRIVHNAMKLHWPFGKAVCKLNTSIAYLNLYATAYFLAAISVERWASVRSSAWAQNPRRNRLAWLVAGGIWFVALAFSSPRIHFGRTQPSPADEEVIICFFNYGQSFKQARVTHHIILIIQYIFAFIIPISVTIACRLKIDQQHRKGIQWGKSFKVTTTVIVLFYLCWLPYHVFSFFETQFIQTSKILIVGIPTSTGLAFSSSCINPIVYVVMGYDFDERPRPPIFSAFENVFGEESSLPQGQTQPAEEMSSQEL